MKAPAGATVAIYVDTAAQVAPGDVIETRSGRRYMVIAMRMQARGKLAGVRQHLKAVVMGDGDDAPPSAIVHRIRLVCTQKRKLACWRKVTQSQVTWTTVIFACYS